MARPKTTTTAEPNKSAAIRTYKAEHPEAKPAEIAKALTAHGMEVNASRVSTVLANRSGGSKGYHEQMKLAATFVRANKGKVSEAVEAIDSIGEFVDACGSSKRAKEALENYRDLMIDAK